MKYEQLLDFQKRVVDEKKDLDSKLLRLWHFIASEEFKKVPIIERGRLSQQFNIMKQYSAILAERIDAF